MIASTLAEAAPASARRVWCLTGCLVAPRTSGASKTDAGIGSWSNAARTPGRIGACPGVAPERQQRLRRPASPSPYYSSILARTPSERVGRPSLPGPPEEVGRRELATRDQGPAVAEGVPDALRQDAARVERPGAAVRRSARGRAPRAGSPARCRGRARTRRRTHRSSRDTTLRNSQSTHAFGTCGALGLQRLLPDPGCVQVAADEVDEEVVVGSHARQVDVDLVQRRRTARRGSGRSPAASRCSNRT